MAGLHDRWGKNGYVMFPSAGDVVAVVASSSEISVRPIFSLPQAITVLGLARVFCTGL